MAMRKRLCDESMSVEEEVKRMETKYASLKEDYVKLQRCSRASKKRAKRSSDKLKRLQAEVKFLRGKCQMFTEKYCEEPVNPSVFPESGTTFLSIYRKPEEPNEVLAIEEESVRCGLAGLQPLMSTDHRATHEMSGLQFSPMRIKSAFTVYHSSSVTPAVEQSNKKRDLENNGLVNAQKPSKFKDGQKMKMKVEQSNKKRDLENNRLVNAQKPSKFKDGQKMKMKMKADILVYPEYSANSITISKRTKKPAEALAIEDKYGRHELNGMQTFSSTDDHTLPEMPSAMRIMPSVKVSHSSVVTPAVIDSRNEKIKTDPLASTEFRARTISISKRPKEPTKGLVIADKPAKHELTRMQLLSSTDDFTAPEMTGLQPSAIRTLSGSKVPHSPLVTPTIEPANKKRRLENNGLMVASAQKPSKVKDDRNRKIKADPLKSPESVARNISMSRRPKEPTVKHWILKTHARSELTGMQPLLSTDDCTLPEMTELQPSARRIMTAFTEPHRSLATPTVELTNKKIHLKINGPVHVERSSNVKDGRNKKSKQLH